MNDDARQQRKLATVHCNVLDAFPNSFLFGYIAVTNKTHCYGNDNCYNGKNFYIQSKLIIRECSRSFQDIKDRFTLHDGCETHIQAYCHFPTTSAAHNLKHSSSSFFYPYHKTVEK